MSFRNYMATMALLAALLITAFFPVDAYRFEPGDAYALDPMVRVEGVADHEAGSLNLMTVAMRKVTLLPYAYYSLTDAEHIMKANAVRSPHETDAAYEARQTVAMTDSQASAVAEAFRLAKKPVSVREGWAEVLSVVDGSAASGVLQPGDELVRVGGKRADSRQALRTALGGRQAGERIELTYRRAGRELTASVALSPIPGARGKIGLGVQYVHSIRVLTDPKVTFKKEAIGGPSGGLMYTLEIYNQLQPGDVTNGLRVAGTGEMLPDGRIGPIGGIDLKVKAAAREGMDIFFAPLDERPPGAQPGEFESNYEAAKRTAEEIGTDMKVVPVQTAREALAYLQSIRGDE